jgi:hypothetical protein
MDTPLECAIKNRDEYLDSNPRLKKYQNEIDEILDKTPENERVHVLSIMMSTKLFELQNELMKLVNEVNK